MQIDFNQIQIIKAVEPDSKILTEISFAAKRHWNYPDNHYEIWKDELSISSDYIIQNIVYKSQIGADSVGFYSIVENAYNFRVGEVFIEKGFWMEHLFIRPEYHKLGIGRLMVEHALNIAKQKRIDRLLVFADPFASGFYEKIGALFLYESKSSIPGRLIPVYELKPITESLK